MTLIKETDYGTPALKTGDTPDPAKGRYKQP